MELFCVLAASSVLFFAMYATVALCRKKYWRVAKLKKKCAMKTEGTVTGREPWHIFTEHGEAIEFGYYCRFRYTAGSREIEREFASGFEKPFNEANEYRVGDRTVIYYNRVTPEEFIPEKCLAESAVRHAVYEALAFAAFMTCIIYFGVS